LAVDIDGATQKEKANPREEIFYDNFVPRKDRNNCLTAGGVLGEFGFLGWSVFFTRHITVCGLEVSFLLLRSAQNARGFS